MSLADYEELVPIVQDLILDNGRLINFVRVVPTAVGATPWKKADLSSGNVVTTSVPAVFVPPSGFALGIKFISEDLLKRCSQVCLVAPHADGVDLSGTQKIVDGSASWTIEWIEVLRPGDLVLLYAFGVKR